MPDFIVSRPRRMPDRRRFLGTTDVPVVMGLSPWKTRVELWREKVGAVRPPEPTGPHAKRLARGRKLEPYVVDMGVDKLREMGHEVEVLYRNRRFIDAAHPYLAAEVDVELRVDGVEVNGDAKTATGYARHTWGEEMTDEMPLHYAAQFMQGLGITRRPSCYAFALLGLDDVRVYRIDRDEETIAGMREQCVAFWQDHVGRRVEPEPQQYSDAALLWPADNGRTIAATDSMAERVNRLVELQRSIARDKADLEALKLDVASYMREFGTLTVAGRPALTWRAFEQTRIDAEALKRHYPDVAAMCETKSTVRALRVAASYRPGR